MTRAALAMVVALALAPLGARGQEVQEERVRGASPRWGSFLIEGMSYRPDVDSEFPSPPVPPATSSTPYHDAFGGSRGWMFKLVFAKTVWDRYGAVDLGIGSGYFADVGHGFDENTGQPTGDKTTFRIVPITLQATYRFDWLARRYDIPFMLYGTAALQRYNWWVTNGAGKTTQSGATNGYTFTAGIGLLLNFFDQTLSRELDRDTGINDVWLVFDSTWGKIDDFGSKKSWILSDSRPSLALGLMFVF